MTSTVPEMKRNCPKDLPSIESLHAMFIYDPESGLLEWRDIRDSMGRRLVRLKRKCGHLNSRGYIKVGIGGKHYASHRIIWKMMTGEEPPEVDHKNNCGSDNRLLNLRAATHALNARNAKRWRGKILPRGVRKHASCSKYEARIKCDGVAHYLGLYDTPAAAHEAYKSASDQLHQQFANHD